MNSKAAENRRNEILDVAEILFTSKGYAKTTIRNILEEVGIARGTFYYYFKSKEEVMDAVVHRFIDVGVNEARKIAQKPGLNAHGKIFQIIMAQNQDVHRKEQMIEELQDVDNAEMHQKSLVETILQLTPVLTEVIEQGIREGVFNTPYPRETVEFLLVSSQFLFDEGIFNWNEEELMQKAIAFTYFLEQTLGAQKDSFSYLLKKIVGSYKDDN